MTAPSHGFDIPGIDLTGLSLLAGMRLSGLSTHATNKTQISFSNLAVTAHGASVTDAGKDWRGDTVALLKAHLLAIVPDLANDDTVFVSSGPLTATIQPGGVVVLALPAGLGGSDLAAPLVFTPNDSGLGATVYIWGTV